MMERLVCTMSSRTVDETMVALYTCLIGKGARVPVVDDVVGGQTGVALAASDNVVTDGET
jgi:hypothetical protein